jgi:FkbM family methyltransferase
MNPFRTIKIIIPGSIKTPIKNAWEKMFPPRILLDRFIKPGCSFEVTTKTERYRVLNFADETSFIEKFLSALGPNDVFFDIGSCIGMYAIHAAKKGSKVVAFEPDPGYRQRLNKNIKINKLKSIVQIIPWAVSNQEGFATLYTDGVDGNSPSLALVGTRGSVSVKTNSIDEAISKLEIPLPTIIKIDIEGAELLALKGMQALLHSATAPRYIFIELHPDFLPGFNATVEECIEIIESSNYEKEYEVSRQNQIHCIFRKK